MMLELPIAEDSSYEVAAGCGPCSECHAGCCRAFAVPLTVQDVFRIHEATGLAFWDFVARWADDDGSIANGIAPHFYFEDDPGTPFVLGLLHRDAADFTDTTCCVFLREANDVTDSDASPGCTGCSIYEHRPAACRLFPAVRHTESGPELIAIPEYGREEPGDAWRLCPRAWTLDEVDLDAVEAVAGNCRREMDLLHVMATLWNRDPGPWGLFPEFLSLVRERVEATAHYSASVGEPSARVR